MTVKIGDLVRRKEGGPILMVMAVFADAVRAWWDDGFEDLPFSALELIER